MNKKQQYLPLALLGFLTLCLISFIAFYPHEAKVEYKKLNLHIGSDPATFDPALAYNDDALTVMSQSIETLYQYHYLKRPLEIEPLLAESMPKISNDGLLYTISLKKGVYYHHHPAFKGEKRELRALDFVNQLKRLVFKPLNSSGKWIVEKRIKGAQEFSLTVGNDFTKFFRTNLEGVRALDNYTLEIELLRPDPNLIYFLAMTFTAPLPKEVLLYHQNSLDGVLVGTGPYILQKKTKSLEFTFKRNQDYRQAFYPSSGDRYANTQDLLSDAKKQIPFVDQVTFKVIPNAEHFYREFLEGGLDVINIPSLKMGAINDQSSEAFKKISNKQIETRVFSTLVFRWLGFNMQDPVFKDNLNFRKAIAYAINYPEYSQTLSQNTSLRANSIFNPGIPGYNPSQSIPFEFNLDTAKKFLGRAGFKKGELPTITYSTRGTTKMNLIEADFVKRSLEKIGLTVKIEKLEFKDFLQKGRSGELQFWTDSWIYDYPDPENILQLLLSSNHPGINKSAYSNKRFDFMYGKLAQTRDLAERLSTAEKMEKIVLEDLPWIPLFYETSHTMNWKRLKNYRKSFFTRNFVKYLDLK